MECAVVLLKSEKQKSWTDLEMSGNFQAAGTSSGVMDDIVSKDQEPKDAQVIKAILNDMGMTEYEPRIITQLLEFVYRYVTNVAEDAKLVSNHAKKKLVDVDDIRLAVQMYNEQNYNTPPSRDVLLEMARSKNSNPLPMPKATSGLRLPPDRFCLTGCNYRLRYKKNQRGGYHNNINRSGIPPNRSGSLASQTRPILTLNPTTLTANRIPITPGTTPSYTMTVNPQPVKRKTPDD